MGGIMIHKIKSFTAAALTAVFLLAGCQQNAETPATAAVEEIILLPAQIKFGSASNVSVTVKGANFDIRGETKIKLWDSAGQEVSASTVTVAPGAGTASEFTASVPLPSERGVFTVTVYFDGKKEAKTATLHLYDDPAITSIAIPRAGISYAGNKLPVTIVGKNFTAPGISAASFSGTGASFSNFNVISDVKATAEVSCPSTAGEDPVMVHCKSASKTGTLSVKDYSAWTPGKIVLADNTLADKDSFTLTTNNPPVAVVFGKNAYGVAFGVALHKEGSLKWAKSDTTGSTTKFGGIICTPSEKGNGAALAAVFTGDTDGSDNWDYICSVDPEGTANAAVNYPAFDWINKYNTTYAARLGNARPAWYMPSLAELCALYKNREAVNASLSKINGSASSYADASFGAGWYWSSSQSSDNNNDAWVADFGSGTLDDFYKNFSSYYTNVCCIAGF